MAPTVTVPSGPVRHVRRNARDGIVKNFFDNKLAERYGYAIAVYIAAKTADLQRGIDATNARRRIAGRRLLEDACVEEVISGLRNKGQLPAEKLVDSVRLPDVGAKG